MEQLTAQDKADRIYDALSSLNEVVEFEKAQTMKDIKTLDDLMSRVTYLKEVCTVHVQTSGKTGHTSTVFEFIEDEELKAVYLTSNPAFAQKVGTQYGKMATVSTWRDANKVSFTGINAIFIDPATHACKKAMHCIYDRAAEQMAITGKAPTIYLIS